MRRARGRPARSPCLRAARRRRPGRRPFSNVRRPAPRTIAPGPRPRPRQAGGPDGLRPV